MQKTYHYEKRPGLESTWIQKETCNMQKNLQARKETWTRDLKYEKRRISETYRLPSLNQWSPLKNTWILKETYIYAKTNLHVRTETLRVEALLSWLD